MSDFKFKMHKNRFRLGLRPRPRWGSLQHSPDPLAGFQGLLLRGGERRGKGPYGEREGRDRGREGREGRGEERDHSSSERVRYFTERVRNVSSD